MGMAGRILTNLTEIDIKKTIARINSSLIISNCFYSISMQKTFNGCDYGFICASEYKGSDDGMVMYAYNRSNKNAIDAEVRCISSDIYEELYIENISENQYLLLRFLHSYMTSSPGALFYIPAIDKLFDKALIEMIYSSEKWEDWYLLEHDDTPQAVFSDFASISHSYVEKNGLAELVLGPTENDVSQILEENIHRFLISNNYYHEIAKSVTLHGITKKQLIFSIGHNEYIEAIVFEDADPMNDDLFDDISKGLGISIVIKYTSGSAQIVKYMLDTCIEDKTNYYIYSETHSPMTLSDYCCSK